MEALIYTKSDFSCICELPVSLTLNNLNFPSTCLSVYLLVNMLRNKKAQRRNSAADSPFLPATLRRGRSESKLFGARVWLHSSNSRHLLGLLKASSKQKISLLTSIASGCTQSPRHVPQQEKPKAKLGPSHRHKRPFRNRPSPWVSKQHVLRSRRRRAQQFASAMTAFGRGSSSFKLQ